MNVVSTTNYKMVNVMPWIYIGFMFLSSSQTGCSFIIAIKEPKDLDAKNFVTHNDLKSKQNNIHSYLAHGILFLTTFSSMGSQQIFGCHNYCIK